MNHIPLVGKRGIATTLAIALIAPAATLAALTTLATPAGALTGDLTTVAGGSLTLGDGPDGFAASAVALTGPVSVAVDSHGNQLIADTGANRIRVVAKSASNPGYALQDGNCAPTLCSWTVGDIFTITGGSLGYTGDGGISTSALLKHPADIAVDPGGNLVIADQGNSAIRVIAMSATNPGYSLRADCSGTCTWAPQRIFTIAGNGSQGYTGDGSGGNSSFAQLSAPGNVAIDAHGNVLIADTVNARIRVIAVSASNPGYQLNAGVWTIGSIFTIAGDGTTGYGGDGQNAIITGTNFSNPHGLTVDSDGNVLVADSTNNRVRVIAVSATVPPYALNVGTWTVGDVFTIAGSAVSGFGGDGFSPVTQTGPNTAKLSNPEDVAVDADGNVVIADLLNERIRVVTVSSINPGYQLATGSWSGGKLFTVAGNAASGYGGDGGSAVAAGAKFNFPAGVAFDAQGNLLVADQQNNVIRSVQYGDGLHFTVPATVPDPNGYDSGYLNDPDNSFTVSASGSWCTNDTASLCNDPAGNAGFSKADDFVNQNDPAWGLLARLGTSGPWTFVGNGATLSGPGELYFIMNDDIDSNCGSGSTQNCYLDNTGTLDVSIAASAFMNTSYSAAGPVLAGTTLDWNGTAYNSGVTTLTNVIAIVTDGTFGTPQEGAAPTWATFAPDGESTVQTGSGTCVPFFGWACQAATLVPGGYMSIDSHVATQGMEPPTTLTDAFYLSSDQNSTPLPAAVHTQRVDGLRFNLSVPSTVYAGDALTGSGSLTNTSASADIDNVVAYGTIDKGSFLSATPGCEFTNNFPLGTGGIERCPAAAVMTPTNIPAGTTTSPASFDIDTTGLAGQTINYTDFATSADIGGVSYVETGSVAVVAPGLVINTPADGATLARTVPNDFTATPTANPGDSITSVTMKLDGVIQTDIPSPPYTYTIPTMTLGVGTHTLTAVAHQAIGSSIIKAITVHAVQRPMVTIVPPSGFASGGTLDTAKTFTATAVPSAPATIASIAWDVDGTITVPSTTLSAVVDPSQLLLSNGSHTLNMTATDSVGQPRTASFNFTIPLATLQVCSPDPSFSVATCNTPVAPIGSPPAPAAVTPGGDSAWTVQVDNTSAFVARHAVLTLDATATDTSNVQTALAFDQNAINGALGRPPSTASCQLGSGATIVCALPDIPASSAVQFPVFAQVPGTFTGPPNVVEATVNGTATASAQNANASAPTALADVSVVSCDGPGIACFQSVVAAGTTVSSSTDALDIANTTAQTIQVPISTQAEAKVVRFGRPFPLQRRRIIPVKGLRAPRVTFKPRVATDPSLRVQLASIDPAQATDPASVSLCTTVIAGAGPCQGQISEVSAAFDPYINPVNPILVVISALWGPSGPPGHLYVQKVDSNGNLLGGPTLLPACIQSTDLTNRAFLNTPCRLPEVVKTLTIDGVTTKTSYSPILFIGSDPHFARR